MPNREDSRRICVERPWYIEPKTILYYKMKLLSMHVRLKTQKGDWYDHWLQRFLDFHCRNKSGIFALAFLGDHGITILERKGVYWFLKQVSFSKDKWRTFFLFGNLLHMARINFIESPSQLYIARNTFPKIQTLRQNQDVRTKTQWDFNFHGKGVFTYNNRFPRK